ncbi:MAG: N-acyl homoserine lactonase family protein [Rhodospirillales bacterium]|nr:N-acyl homoserine lactonase family protein [Rhodospirillales bacterium]
MTTLVPYEIYAVRYAHHHERRASENFLGGDPHDGPMPIDYFVWAIVGQDKTYVVDTGFDGDVGKKRGREVLRCPSEGLAMVGVEPGRVRDVIITHMHFDHCGNHHLFPDATFHLQDLEMAYVTGRHMCHAPIGQVFEAKDVCAMVRRVFGGRLQFHDGTEELAPGLSVHLIGGHTMGLQAVRVWTRRGWVVLASDASHLYANMEQERPFPIIYNLGDMLEGYRTLQKLASSREHIVPGHDPLVLKRYPAPKKGLEGIAVRLDVEPIRD